LANIFSLVSLIKARLIFNSSYSPEISRLLSSLSFLSSRSFRRRNSLCSFISSKVVHLLILAWSFSKVSGFDGNSMTVPGFIFSISFSNPTRLFSVFLENLNKKVKICFICFLLVTFFQFKNH